MTSIAVGSSRSFIAKGAKYMHLRRCIVESCTAVDVISTHFATEPGAAVTIAEIGIASCRVRVEAGRSEGASFEHQRAIHLFYTIACRA